MNLLPTLETLPLMFQQTTDQLGNIFDAAGNHIGVQVGSVADVGSKGVKLPPLKGDTSWIDNPTGMQGIPTPVAPARPTSNSSTPTTLPTPDFGALKDWSLKHPFGYDGANPIDQAKKAANAVLHPVDTATSFIFTSRLVFLVIGLLLFGAGLFQFRATQTVIETGTKVAKTAAKFAA